MSIRSIGIKNTLFAYALPLALLVVMGVLMVASVKNDSYIGDEVAHLPAGYSYLTQQTMRLNVEQPPLVKDLAALPLLFMDLRMSSVSDLSSSAVGDIWHGAQWEFGQNFLFNQEKSINNIVFWGRIPMIFLTLLLGFFIFYITRRHFGNLAGTLAVFFFVFSPTILANGRYITMDVPAALGAFAAVYFYVRALNTPSKRNILIAGIVLGVAELIKFSLLLIFPFFIFVLLIKAAVETSGLRDFVNKVKRYSVRFVIIALVSVVIISFVYQLHLINYPKLQQQQDIQVVLADTNFANLSGILGKLSQWGPSRSFSHYLLGVFWQMDHASFGHISFFSGEGSMRGWKSYFPVAYLIKEPVALHIFVVISLVYVLRFLGNALKSKKKALQRVIKAIKIWFKKDFFVAISLVWIVFYALSITVLNSLNIGIRHLLPIYPFLFLLLGGTISLWLRRARNTRLQFTIVGALIAWQIISVVGIYPSFLSYFNEIIGGPDEGYKYLVDSNLDWQQDTKRLAIWVDERHIRSIKIPHESIVHFSDNVGAHKYTFYSKSYELYLEEGYEYLSSDTPTEGWLAISATLLQWGRTRPAEKGGWWSDSYRWLDPYEPVAKIGSSIFVYYIDDIEPGIQADYKAKLESARRIVDINPSSQNFFNVGFYAVKTGNFKEAIEANKETIRLEPDNAIAYNNLGTAYNNLEMWDEAIEALDKALKLDPNFELARNNLRVAREGKEQ